jgi:hypothetical protein
MVCPPFIENEGKFLCSQETVSGRNAKPDEFKSLLKKETDEQTNRQEEGKFKERKLRKNERVRGRWERKTNNQL